MTDGDAPARLLLTGRIVGDGTSIRDGAVAFDGDRICYVGTAAGFAAEPGAADFERAGLPADTVLLPGLVDLHCHGAAGADFSSAGPDEAGRAAAFLHRAGTTTLLASLVSGTPAHMLAAAARLADLAEAGLVAGIHAEGPFLSAARCGAQDPSAFGPPDPELVDGLVGAARGQLRTMTFAPELRGAEALVEQLASHGVVPSVGHTDADAATTAGALRLAREELGSAGFDGYTARPTATHLFNAMRPEHHRSTGVAAACLEVARTGDAVVELIADGTHLHPDTVRTVFALVGAGSVALVTDSMAAAGLGDGDYRLGGVEVSVRSGEAHLAPDGPLAGGVATLLDVVRVAIAAGVPENDAVAAATRVPAAVLGLADEVGSLHVGLRADVLAVDPGYRLRAVFRGGRRLEHPGR